MRLYLGAYNREEGGRGLITGMFFLFQTWGAYIRGGVYNLGGGLISGILRYFTI